jgi:hypothetical protein
MKCSIQVLLGLSVSLAAFGKVFDSDHPVFRVIEEFLAEAG